MRPCTCRPSLFAILGCGLLLAGCSGSIAPTASSTPPAAAEPESAAPAIGDGLASGVAAVYAHTSRALFAVDPQTLAVAQLGEFKWPGAPDSMTDLAVDRAGGMIGISFNRVYRVSPATLECTELGRLQQRFVGLSYLTAEAGGEEQLVATGKAGEVYRIDPVSGASTLIGEMGGGLGSSGDLVSVARVGTVATVSRPGSRNDWLARVDPQTGAATLIGDTGFKGIWGLGFWHSRVYGFTDAAQFVLIDPATGRASLVASGGGGWWGAGVTTSAPVIR